MSSQISAIALAAAIAGATRPAHAAFECNDTSWEGMSEFLSIARAVATAPRVRLMAELDYSALTADDAVVFIHPEVELDASSLSAFVQQGGRAAVLDDFGKSVSFSERFGIARVPVPPDPVAILRQNHHLSVGTPVEIAGPDGTIQRHPLVRDVERVVLNHPTGLSNPGLTTVLELKTRSGTSLPVAVTGVVGTTQPGRLLVMSDPSAFINLMIRYPGNRDFAAAIVRYLTEDDGRTGKGRLLIVANRFQQTGRFAITNGKLEDAVEAIRQGVRRLQQGFPPPVLLALAVAAALATARWIARYVWRRSDPTLPRFLRPVPDTTQAGWPGRAAVLAATGTHPALLLVELREAFRAQLAELISADVAASTHVLVATVEARQLLPPDLKASLVHLLEQLDSAERAVSEHRPFRVAKTTLARLLKESLDILDHLSQRERAYSEPSPTSQ